MAVTTPQLKSQPDISRLNTFTGHTVTVTKHLAPRNVNGQMVVATTQMPLKAILDLITTLPLQHGPGYYMFRVADTGGSGEDDWMVRLGPEMQEGSSMLPGSPAPNPYGTASGMPSGPLSEGVRQIGPGYFYDENLGTLVTPWRAIVQWRPGEALPQAPSGTTAAGTATNATAWPPAGGPGWGAWGGYPVEDSKATKALEAQIADMQRRAEMDAIRADQQRREEEQRRREEERDRRDQQRREEERREFQAIIERLTAKPTGPSEIEMRLQREVEETKRRLEEQQREETRRRELQAQEDRFRAELRAQQEKTDAILHELKATPKNDPMMAVMTTILSGAQQQASDAVRAIRESSERTATAQERHTTQIMEAMRTDKTGAAEMAKTMLENTRNMVELQGSVYQQMLEQASSGGAPWYADAIQNATKQIGAVVAAVGSRNQQQQQQQVQRPQMMAPPRPRPRAPAITQPIPSIGAPLPPVPPVSPTMNTTGGRPDGTEYDPETDEFVLVGGHRVKSTLVQQHGWAKTIAALARRQTLEDPVAVAAAQVSPQVIAAHVQSAVSEPEVVSMNGASGPAMHAPASAKKSRKQRGEKTKLESVPAPVAPPAPVRPDVVVPPPADPAGRYNRDELKALDTDQVLMIVRPIADDLFFGDLWEHVEQLRMAMPEPTTAAQYIAQGYAQLNAAGKTVPATELLIAGQINAIVERLFPGAAEEYTEAVAMELARALGMEIIEEDEEA